MSVGTKSVGAASRASLFAKLSFAAALVAGGAADATAPAAAQNYPSKEVKLVVPFPTMGVTDLNARILAKHLTRLWGQGVTIVNMPGDGGTKGTMFVLSSPKDGITM